MTFRHPIARILPVLLLAWPLDIRADEKLAGVACRSVHLRLKAPRGTAFVNTVRVEKSAPGTYFCVGGFDHGYLGIQELSDGKKVVIFSVWEPGKQDDPKAVAPDLRVKLISRGEGVRAGRFGNEGTGGQSFLDLDWQSARDYTFLLASRPDGDRTEYSAFLMSQDRKSWRAIATFSTITGGANLSGYYAFIEDFRRNRVSATQPRQARFGPAWARSEKDSLWHPVTAAQFTADRNPSRAIDAGECDSRFFLATGGDTANDHTPLGKTVSLANSDPMPTQGPPPGLPPLP